MNIEVTEKELALLTIIRTLGHGTIEKIGVYCGEPMAVMSTTQRIDLSRRGELDQVLDCARPGAIYIDFQKNSTITESAAEEISPME